MIYQGRMKDGVVVFDDNERPADGTKVSVEIISAPVENTSAKEQVTETESAEEPTSNKNWLLEFAGVVKGLPSDASEQHDHYLYGTPKR